MITTLARALGLGAQRPFRLFQVEPTMRCNLRCVMCPWPAQHQTTADLSWDTFQKLMPYLSLAHDLDLTGGGEPLLHPRLTDMVRAGKSAGCTVGFSTNATLLTPEIARELVTCGLDWIAYSLDGATPTTYESIRRGAHFDAVVENIRQMQAARSAQGRGHGRSQPLTFLFFVMMRQNLHELPAVVALAHELGIDQVVAKNLDVVLKEGDENQLIFGGEGYQPPAEVEDAIGRARAEARRLDTKLRVYELQRQEAVICEQDPLNTAFVNWEGCVSPCITLAYAQRQWWDGRWYPVERQRWGNVATDPLPDILQRPAARQFLAHYEARRYAWFTSAAAASAELPGGRSAFPPAPEACQRCGYLYGI